MLLRFSTPGVSSQGDRWTLATYCETTCTEEEMIILLTTIEFDDAGTKQERQPSQNRPPGTDIRDATE
jgi:hypothetical protein